MFTYNDKQTPSKPYNFLPFKPSKIEYENSKSLGCRVSGVFAVPHKHAINHIRPTISTLAFLFYFSSLTCTLGIFNINKK